MTPPMAARMTTQEKIVDSGPPRGRGPGTPGGGPAENDESSGEVMAGPHRIREAASFPAARGKCCLILSHEPGGGEWPGRWYDGSGVARARSTAMLRSVQALLY